MVNSVGYQSFWQRDLPFTISSRAFHYHFAPEIVLTFWFSPRYASRCTLLRCFLILVKPLLLSVLFLAQVYFTRRACHCLPESACLLFWVTTSHTTFVSVSFVAFASSRATNSNTQRFFWQKSISSVMTIVSRREIFTSFPVSFFLFFRRSYYANAFFPPHRAQPPVFAWHRQAIQTHAFVYLYAQQHW